MGHTAVSATQASSVTFLFWQHGAKENNSKFETFKRVVNTKSSIIQMVPNHFDKIFLAVHACDASQEQRLVPQWTFPLLSFGRVHFHFEGHQE